MRLSDYVIDFIADQKIKHIFMVSGGGGMYLIDSLGRNNKIKYVCNHHEQASTMSAEGYQRVTGNLGVALVTTGPAGTNTITGIMCAWNDSIPLLMISGQANSKFLIGNTGLRQRAVHEADITKIVQSITKYAVTIKDPETIRYHLEKAVFLAKNGRPGPVWIDIPLDIQCSEINPKTLKGFNQEKESLNYKFLTNDKEINKIASLILKSERPIIIAGHGIRLSKSIEIFIKFLNKYKIPVVTTKNAIDIIAGDNPMLAGRVGIYGQRSANFAIQNSDLVLCLGTRLAFPVIGYNYKFFAREAKKIVVDIDKNQLEHSHIKIDFPINDDLKSFIPRLDSSLNGKKGKWESWILKCQHWRKKYPSVEEEQRQQKKYVNTYYFFEILSKILKNDDIIVTDQGASFYCSTQAFEIKNGQRLFTNGGFSPMGYGLPAAIGACFANNKKRVICVHGDGGLQLNIQELQTVIHHKLPIKLFVFNNLGYVSIKHTQSAYFNGFFVGSDPNSGLSCPDTTKIAKAYGFKTIKINSHKELKKKIQKSLNKEGPVVIEVMVDPLQSYGPRVTSVKSENGYLITKPLEDMSPLLNRKEFNEEMIIKPVNENEK